MRGHTQDPRPAPTKPGVAAEARGVSSPDLAGWPGGTSGHPADRRRGKVGRSAGLGIRSRCFLLRRTLLVPVLRKASWHSSESVKSARLLAKAPPGRTQERGSLTEGEE